jgi:hypothetical protein
LSAKGINSFDGSGKVASEVLFSETRGGEPACSFRLAIEQSHKSTVFVRINAYGGIVDVVRRRELSSGDYCVVSGELMNRRSKDQDLLTEVRAIHIVIPHSQGRYNDGSYS